MPEGEPYRCAFVHQPFMSNSFGRAKCLLRLARGGTIRLRGLGDPSLLPSSDDMQGVAGLPSDRQVAWRF